jgi:CRISPR/Cas system-associated protein Cas10 (large subunit of type III CRISPR-Cas system)
MKDHAQSILQFSSHPLEPIVALEIKKMYQAKLSVASLNLSTPYIKELQTSTLVSANENWDIDWYNNYE